MLFRHEHVSCQGRRDYLHIFTICMLLNTKITSNFAKYASKYVKQSEKGMLLIVAEKKM